MNYSLEIRPDALTDIEEAASWYEEHEAGLGTDFVKTVLAAIDSVLANPHVHRLRDRRRNIRWILTNRFPYKVVYKIQDQLVTVVAVLHTARHERRWKQRV
ncbi:MAG TPA: type II toxin-antitoxin system RelE/ParE family toxin [Pyrinomonadaceae bacterium]